MPMPLWASGGGQLGMREQVLGIMREVGDRHGEAKALGNLGNAYLDLGEPRRAIENFGQVLSMMCEIGDRRGEATALGNLGAVYRDLGEPQRAIEYHQPESVDSTGGQRPARRRQCARESGQCLQRPRRAVACD